MNRNQKIRLAKKYRDEQCNYCQFMENNCSDMEHDQEYIDHYLDTGRTCEVYMDEASQMRDKC